MRLWWIVLVVGCAQPPQSPHVSRDRIEVTRSSPEAFFGLENLTSVTESTFSTNEFGSGSHSRLIVSRGNQVTCVTPFGQFGRHENHSFGQAATLELASPNPVRFAVKLESSSNDLGSQTSCTGFELPPSGECRQVFERKCSNEFCTPNVRVERTCGSGTLKGHVTLNRDPVVDATVLAGQLYAFTDEHGAFTLEPGPGSHVLEIDGATLEPQRTTVTVDPQQDVDVAIAIQCTQVIDPACCRFFVP